MKFKERYTTDKRKEPDKVQVSDDAFAIGEMLEELKITIKNFGINR